MTNNVSSAPELHDLKTGSGSMYHQGDVIAFWKLAVTVRCEAITYDVCGTTYKAC